MGDISYRTIRSGGSSRVAQAGQLAISYSSPAQRLVCTVL